MKNRINESRKHFSIDWILIIIIALNAITGIIALYLSVPLNDASEGLYELNRQIMWYGISTVVVILLIKMGTDRLFTLCYPVYWVLMFLLFIQVLASRQIIHTGLIPKINGAYAWYVIPGVGSFQPSEFMKITLVLIGANIIVKHNAEKTSSNFKDDFQLLFKLAAYVLPAILLIFFQPDTGIPIIIVFSFAVMYMISGVRREWFIIITSIAAFLFIGIIYLYYNNQPLLNSFFGGSASSYKLDRFYGWLDYEKYSIDQGHHLYNAISSIGTAGWNGHTLQSVILQYPESKTDFIFAVLAQNFGFIGASFVVIIAFALDLKIASIAYLSEMSRERAMLAGVLGMLVFQHFQNMGMVLGILPITGITLPFISYGGSSVLSYMIPVSVALYMYSEKQNAHRH